MSFKHLFTPHEIRGLEIRKRIYSTAHQTILPRFAEEAVYEGLIAARMGVAQPNLVLSPYRGECVDQKFAILSIT